VDALRARLGIQRSRRERVEHLLERKVEMDEARNRQFLYWENRSGNTHKFMAMKFVQYVPNMMLRSDT
jgi:ABC-type phosphate transport system auxiliary subunit